MEEVSAFWAVLQQRLDDLIRRLYEISPEHLLLTALLACFVALLLLMSRLRSGRAYRRLRDERDTLNQQLATLQSAYDKEILWRTASEKHGMSKDINPKNAVEVDRR